MLTVTEYKIICQTGNGDPPPKKPPTAPARRRTDTPLEESEESTEGAE